MPSIQVGPTATKVALVGHGISVHTRIEIAPHVFLCQPAWSVRAEELRNRTSSHLEYAAILSMAEQADFALEVGGNRRGNALGAAAWNALWFFGLISLATRSICCPLFAFSDEPEARYTLTNRNLVIWPRGPIRPITSEEIAWTRDHVISYHDLILEERFSAAIRSLNNSRYLFDFDQRIMLIWAGIEGLLGVDGELRRRIALHAVILMGGELDQKFERFERIKKAYDFRSKVVHGSKRDDTRLSAEHDFAAGLLSDLLAKCVELGRVPSAKELDEAALVASIG